MKISYSGTPNMASILTAHNRKLIDEKRTKKEQNQNCNCRGGVDRCPMQGRCLTSAIVYKATVTAEDGEQKTYIGSTDRTFKERFYGHTADMKNKEHRKNTTLAGYIWDKRDEGIPIKSVKWEIVKKCHKYKAGGDMCDVCLSEKLAIMKAQDNSSLNRRCELMNRCVHKWKHKLNATKNL